MRYGFILILAAFQMVCGHLSAEPQPAGHETAGEVRVMSWNILHKGWEVEGHASWKQRVRGVVQILREQKPDVVGLQEDGKDQVAYITNALNLIHGAEDPRGTWRGLGNEHHGERIDHILINGQVKVLGAEIIFYDGIKSAYPSDHYPVQATLSTRRLQEF